MALETLGTKIIIFLGGGPKSKAQIAEHLGIPDTSPVSDRWANLGQTLDALTGTAYRGEPVVDMAIDRERAKHQSSKDWLMFFLSSHTLFLEEQNVLSKPYDVKGKQMQAAANEVGLLPQFDGTRSIKGGSNGRRPR